MPHVVTGNCVDCRYTDCVEVCPVDCFFADAKQVYIDPDTCIDCGACIDACPVHAIFNLDDLSVADQKWIAINEQRSQASDVVNIFETEAPLETAAAKRAQLGLG